MGLPLYSARTKFPRDIPWEQPPPTGWARYLAWESSNEDSDLDVPVAEGWSKQGSLSGIMPCTSEMMKNDVYKELETFKISCKTTGHETTVHNCVVLNQSQWLKDNFESRDDPAAPVYVPTHIRWWQLAWALEYMYEGRVPGFHLLAGENMPARFPRRIPRSIVWGLLELWEAAHFFGLQGLMDRAEGAFVEYFCEGIRHAILVHRGARDRTPEEVAGSLAGREPRVAHEFRHAAWKLFGHSRLVARDYFRFGMSNRGLTLMNPLAEDKPAILAWESAMFDKPRAPRDQDIATETSALHANAMMRGYFDTFKPKMLDLCMLFLNAGLLELEWFQIFMIYIQLEHWNFPNGLTDALSQKMEESPDKWPKDEFPRAPFSFERVDPWRLIASNARTVPSMPQNVEQEAADEEQ